MNISTSKSREQFPLSRAKISKKTLGSALIWIILFIIAEGFSIFALITSGISAAFFILGSIAAVFLLVLIILATFLYQKWYFSVYYYELGQDYIVIKKGPITPKEITIPYERVQDVYVDQDLLDRFFGLYDVHLSSATISSGMEAHIDGVKRQAADGLKNVLLATVSERISKKKLQSTI
jgi:membrane protein YdbS with pleckstrin-like domain